MNDVTGRELETGDLILDMRTTYGWNSLGIVQGGVTAGGSIRYISIWNGKKKNSKEKCLVKINREQFEEIFQLTVQRHLRWNNHENYLKYGYDKIMEIYNNLNN